MIRESISMVRRSVVQGKINRMWFVIFMIAAILAWVVWEKYNAKKPVKQKHRTETSSVIQRIVQYSAAQAGLARQYLPNPPYKKYKPGYNQQIGVLVSETTGETLPLFGKETLRHRDRYNYYTVTPGNQMYPLPIKYDNKDSMEDLGLKEFFGDESVTVLGRDSEPYKVKIYRNMPLVY